MRHFSKQICPRFQAAMDILGRRWTGLILHVLSEGPQRFAALSSRLEVVSERMLSERLKQLTREGIVERQIRPEHPGQAEYRLTEKGLALRPLLAAIGSWAEHWADVERSERSVKRRR